MKTSLLCAVWCCLVFPHIAYGQPALNTTEKEAVAIITQIYTDVSGKSAEEVNKDMAFIGVVYAASFPNTDRPAQQGIDFWLLTRKEKDWKVVAVTNETILPGEEIPPMFE